MGVILSVEPVRVAVFLVEGMQREVLTLPTAPEFSSDSTPDTRPLGALVWEVVGTQTRGDKGTGSEAALALLGPGHLRATLLCSCS